MEGIVGAATHIGIQQQKIDDCLKASLNPPRALRRMRCDVVENFPQVG